MILAYKKQFVPKVKDGTKIHTFREDKPDRWKVGNKIHHATGVRTKNYNCFKDDKCISIQNVQIEKLNNTSDVFLNYIVWIDGFHTPIEKVKQIAINDGFENVEAFFKWFDGNWKGKLIHWTNKRY